MYYPSLKNLNEDKLTKMLDKEIIEETINKLDTWLISMNEYRTYRLNPKQFALDKNVNSKVAKNVFFAGINNKIFDIFFEVRSDDNEYLNQITKEQYLKLLEGQNLYLYSLNQDSEIEVELHNVQIWFKLLAKPELVPSSFESSQESEANALSGEEITKHDVHYWLD